ncbi:MAG: T9SS type A sorting domain-containing protein [Ignavibacteria bacterium]|nr:T9SS type A sorting domain-containing protein [Ignavibacteria bacterium]
MFKKIFLIAAAFLLFASNIKATPPAEPDLAIEWQKYMYPTEISFAKFSADGNYIYCAVGNTIQKMDASNGEFVSTFDNVDTLFIYQINKMQISNSGNYIVADNGDGAALVYDTKTEKKIKQLQIGASCVSISNDDKYLLIGSGRPETSGVIIYNLQADKIDTVLSFAHNGISAIQISHDGKYFVTGYKERKVDIEEIWYQKLILWDCNTFEQITVLENIELSSDWGYRHLKFSNDDNYLSVVRENYYAAIYNLNTKKQIKLFYNNDGREKYCMNLHFLPDINYFLVFFVVFEDVNVYELELHNFNGKIKTYNYLGDIMESYGNENNWWVFYGGGAGPYYMFKNDASSVSPSIINKENISITTNNNLICIDLIDIHAEQLSIIISDLLGKTIYTENIQVSQSNCKIPINLNLNTGTYLCKVIAGNKEYTQKIEIVR